MDICAICEKHLSNADSSQRPCCSAKVHTTCINGYAKYSHSSGNPNPACPICKQQSDELRSTEQQRHSLLSAYTRPSYRSEGPSSIASAAPVASSPKSPRLARAETIVHQAEVRSAQKDRRVADAVRNIADEEARLSSRSRDRERRSRDPSPSPRDASPAIGAFKATIAALEDKLRSQSDAAQLAETELDQKLTAETSRRKELEQKFDSLANYSADLQRTKNELTTQLEIEKNDHAACRSKLSTSESEVQLLNIQREKVDSDRKRDQEMAQSLKLDAERALGTSDQEQEQLRQQVDSLASCLAESRQSLEEANDRLTESISAQKYYENQCSELSSSNDTLQFQINDVRSSEENSRVELEGRLQDHIRYLQSELSRSQQEKRMLKGDLDASLFESDRSRQTIAAFEQSNDGLNQQLIKAREELQRSQSGLEQSLQTVALLQQDNDALTTSQGELLQQSRSEVETSRQTMTAVNDLNDELTERLAEARAELEQHRRDAQIAFDQEQQSFAEQSRSMQQALDESERRCGEIHQEKAKLAERSSDLQEQFDQHLSATSDLRQALSESEDGREAALTAQNDLRTRLDDAVSSAVQFEQRIASLEELLASFDDTEKRCRDAVDKLEDVERQLNESNRRQQEHQDRMVELMGLKEEAERRCTSSKEAEMAMEERVLTMTQSLNAAEELCQSTSLCNAQLQQRLDDVEAHSRTVIESRDRLESEAEQHDDRLKTIRTEGESLKDELVQCQEDNCKLRKELTDLITTNELLERSKSELLEQVDALNVSNDALVSTTERIQEAHDQQMQQHAGEFALLQEENEDVSESLAKLSLQFETLAEDRSDIDLKLQSSQECSTRQLVEIQQLRDALTLAASESTSAEDRYHTRLDELVSKVDESAATSAQQEATIERLTDALLAEAAAAECCKSSLSDAEREVAQQAGVSAQLQGQIGELTAQHGSLSEANDRLRQAGTRSEQDMMELKATIHDHVGKQQQRSESFRAAIDSHLAESKLWEAELALAKSLVRSGDDIVAGQRRQVGVVQELVGLVQADRAVVVALHNENGRVLALLEAVKDAEEGARDQMGSLQSELIEKESEVRDLKANNGDLAAAIVALQDDGHKSVVEHLARVTELQAQLDEAESLARSPTRSTTSPGTLSSRRDLDQLSIVPGPSSSKASSGALSPVGTGRSSRPRSPGHGDADAIEATPDGQPATDDTQTAGAGQGGEPRLSPGRHPASAATGPARPMRPGRPGVIARAAPRQAPTDLSTNPALGVPADSNLRSGSRSPTPTSASAVGRRPPSPVESRSGASPEVRPRPAPPQRPMGPPRPRMMPPPPSRPGRPLARPRPSSRPPLTSPDPRPPPPPPPDFNIQTDASFDVDRAPAPSRPEPGAVGRRTAPGRMAPGRPIRRAPMAPTRPPSSVSADATVPSPPGPGRRQQPPPRQPPPTSSNAPGRDEQAELRQRHRPQSPPRSRSLLGRLMPPSLDSSAAGEKVDYVFHRASASWLPEGSAVVSDEDEPDSNVLDTVQRIRSQIQQEIRSTSAELDSASPIVEAVQKANDGQCKQVEKQWVQARELLREAQRRLPSDDPLHVRIEQFLDETAADAVLMSDAVSELEDLLQTVQVQEDAGSEPSRCSIGRAFMIVVLMGALALGYMAVYHPDVDVVDHVVDLVNGSVTAPGTPLRPSRASSGAIHEHHPDL